MQAHLLEASSKPQTHRMAEQPEIRLNPNHVSYYSILGVSKDSTTAEIKSAYHKLLLAHHPDKQHSQPVEGDHKPLHSIQQLQQAYRTLIDEDERRFYEDALHAHYIKLGLVNGQDNSGHGIDINGIDKLDLSEFAEVENDDEEVSFTHVCPRCSAENGFVVTEKELEEGISLHGVTVDSARNSNYQLLIQCSSCSLWLCVTYSIA